MWQLLLLSAVVPNIFGLWALKEEAKSTCFLYKLWPVMTFFFFPIFLIILWPLKLPVYFFGSGSAGWWNSFRDPLPPHFPEVGLEGAVSEHFWQISENWQSDIHAHFTPRLARSEEVRKRGRSLNFSLKLSFFPLLHTNISVTFHVNRRHYECLPGENVCKCAPLYLNDISSPSPQCRPALHSLFHFERGRSEQL